MALTGEAKNKYNKQYRENLKKAAEFLDSLVEKDKQANGERYLSEALSYEDLGKIYYGQPYKDVDDEDEDPRRKKKVVLPNPSATDILGMPRSFEEWLQLRDQARKDLFWLGRDVFRKDFIPHVHQPVCDQFVQKKFDGCFPSGYTIGNVHEAIGKQERFDAEGNPTREAIILDPRGFYKSTIDSVDCVQWLINVPDIRILIMAADHKIGSSLMKEIKGYLHVPKGGDFTDFHLLFPEYVIRGKDGTSSTPLTLPCRGHFQRFPSLWFNSIESGLSGWHCDIKKSDDVVNDENCIDTDVREALNTKIDGADNLLDEWGFSDNIGTRYYGDPVPDWYGDRLKKASEPGNGVKYFCRACWTVRPEFSEVPLKELTEDMVILTFPEKATFKSLRKKLLQNETQFRCQQLNEPAGADKDNPFKVQFGEDILRRHLYQKEAAPQEGDVYICWDWALTANKRSDYSAGVVGRVYKRADGRHGLVILEVACDKWTSSELALQIISLNKKWNPKKTLIENSPGAEWLKSELHRLAPVFGVTLDVFWKPPSLQENAKRNRVKGLETLLKEDLLWFVIGHWIDQTFKQLQDYTGEKKNKGRKDDIPDAMSYFHVAFFPLSSMNQKDAEEAKVLIKEEKEKAQQKAQYERIFGKPQNQSIFVPPAEEPTSGWRPRWPTRSQQ
jgi:phage terminase large subunit-like protein